MMDAGIVVTRYPKKEIELLIQLTYKGLIDFKIAGR
jgi:hypothetical protein